MRTYIVTFTRTKVYSRMVPRQEVADLRPRVSITRETDGSWAMAVILEAPTTVEARGHAENLFREAVPDLWEIRQGKRPDPFRVLDS